MRYRYRLLLAGDHRVGAFVDLGERVSTVLFTDYFYETPRHRAWKRPASLDAATADDLEPEVIAAHASLIVAEAAWTGELSPDPSSVRGAAGETAIRLAAYRALRELVDRAGDLTPAMNEIGMEIETRVSARFETERGPNGQAWAAHAASTLATYPQNGNHKHVDGRPGGRDVEPRRRAKHPDDFAAAFDDLSCCRVANVIVFLFP